MAGDPLMTALLMGLGIDELSMVPSSVPLVKSIVRSITTEQSKELAKMALGAGTASEVLERCRELAAKVAPEILELVQ